MFDLSEMMAFTCGGADELAREESVHRHLDTRTPVLGLILSPATHVPLRKDPPGSVK